MDAALAAVEGVVDAYLSEVSRISAELRTG